MSEEVSPSGPDRWMVVRVRHPGDEDAAALVSDVLLESGGRAVLDEGGALVTHVPEPSDPEGWRAALRERLAAVCPRPPEVTFDWQAQEDWAEIWKRGLAPRRLAGRVVVTPSWCDPDVRPDDLVVVVDPGMAFGNAEHGTTRGCIRLLARLVEPGDRILDVGAGSGILSIVAAGLGAAEVVAVEADAWAIEPARSNVERNGVADRVTVVHATATSATLSGRAPFDGVVANIDGGVLRSLLPGLCGAVVEGGWLVLSGVPSTGWSELEREVEGHGFSTEALDRDGEWCSAASRKRKASS